MGDGHIKNIKNFWKGLIVGGDANASLAKTMLWLTFAALLGSWFALPERDIRELTFVFDSLLLYVLGGKAAWTFSSAGGKRRAGGKPYDAQL